MTQPATSTEPTAQLPAGKPLVVITVGSDHHPFDRLTGWVDRWLADGAADRVDCVIQYGTAAVPEHGIAVPYLDYPELQRLLAAATVVVTQGGPMSMVESRRGGRQPIVVARLPEVGEVVDGHQAEFCGRLASAGLIQLVGSATELVNAIETGLADPESSRVEVQTGTGAHPPAVDRVGRIADALVTQRRGQGPTVLILGGLGRSGSTLLERCLGQMTGMAALGEVLHLWERGLRDDQRCGCGQPFSACPFWQDVGRRAFGGWSEVPAEPAVDDRYTVVRNRHLPALLVGQVGAGARLRRNRLLRRVGALYAAAEASTGAQVLVDSSKHPAYGFLLRRAAVRLRCVLVVRDPRGVAYSWTKHVVRPEVTTGTELMPRYSVAASTVRWSLYSMLFHLLRLVGVPTLIVKYEQLVADPRATLTRVARFAGLDPAAMDFGFIQPDGSVRLDQHHTVAGNPMRFTIGRVEVRPDDAWRDRMPAARRRIVSLLSVPMRYRYGYFGRIRSRGRARSTRR
ncbi:MAG: sulfotransferase [Sporichthyaceae bacterium]|nr:sulfotransferase [Sporichthyaceae bacterium]